MVGLGGLSVVCFSNFHGVVNKFVNEPEHMKVRGELHMRVQREMGDSNW